MGPISGHTHTNSWQEIWTPSLLVGCFFLNNQACQRMTCHFKLSLQRNVSPITGFVWYIASYVLDRPKRIILPSTPACLITFMTPSVSLQTQTTRKNTFSAEPIASKQDPSSTNMAHPSSTNSSLHSRTRQS